MDDSLFARLGNDPTRIFAHFYGQPAPGGICRLGIPAKREEVGADGPAPAEPAEAPAASADRPPGAAEEPPLGLRPSFASEEHRTTEGSVAASDPAPNGEGGVGGTHDLSEAGNPPEPGALARQGSQGGGGGSPSGAPPAESPLHPSRTGEGGEHEATEQSDPNPDMHDWLVRNWDAIKALEAAGKLPDLTPPEPEPADQAPAEPDHPAEPPLVHVARGDRWNKWKMAEFLRQLAATHSVTAAARAVGLSRNSAYKLRARLKGQPFDIAWEAAFRHGYDELSYAALELALEGEEVPHYHKGELVGTHRKRNPQLIVSLLKMRNSAGAPMLGRYGAAAEFWSEHWERMVHRVETGSVTWSDEREGLGKEELAKLDLPDEQRQIDLIIARNRPDEPRGR